MRSSMSSCSSCFLDFIVESNIFDSMAVRWKPEEQASYRNDHVSHIRELAIEHHAYEIEDA